ncbi:hypothetical protein [Granulicella arctica]|uniref:hypothetical protein n=1 Tax=Granulicella arctica TaxID=940613 RepID=UPI0021DFC99D|nr:hypothetical protein [Granulicella arctica]
MTDLFSFAGATAEASEEMVEAAPERAVTAALFGDEPELPPTWSEGSEVFHTTEKCNRLHAIRRNNRITGKPGVKMRLCFNCEDIIRTKRSG